ncbi:MAG: hypothetical protein QOD00_2419 [Blastocatellia bacterium]|jgi:hypothetical protein|nr:hypothetical protein [Blastocatellia bacterium]
MASFKLTKGAETYDLDVFGPVKNQAGQAIGKWGTDNNNNVVITNDAGDTIVFNDVIWKFNTNNQLSLNVANTEVINFHKVGNRPFYSTQNAVLKVRPDQNNIFEFSLRGEWDMSDTHDLSITIKGVTSIVDGFIQDMRGRFIYHFFDKGSVTLEESLLGFAGEWKQDADDPLKLSFKYKREDNSEDVFDLPKSVTINRTMNQFMYEYDKKGQKFRLQFMGVLKVSDDFSISYTFDEQKAQNGDVLSKQTTLTIQAKFDKKNFSGNIDFKVEKKGGGSSTISLHGNFTAVYVKNVRLSIGFAFDQETSMGKVQSTIAFNGTLQFGSGGKIQWTFQRNATTTSVTLSASDIKIGSARIDGILNIDRGGGQIVGVHAIFGIVI